MAHRPIRVVPAAALREGFEAIRREADVPTAFPPEVEAEARAVAASQTARARRRAVRDDRPAGLARPRPGAAHRARAATGTACATRSPTSRAFVAPGGALDAEAHARGVTVYAPDAQGAAAPAGPVGGRREPAARAVAPGGAVDARPRRRRRARRHRRRARRGPQRRAAHLRRRPGAELAAAAARRSASGVWRSRSRAAACGSTSPSRRSCARTAAWTVRYRVPLPTEDHNAQVSLLTGMAAAAADAARRDRHPAHPAAARRARAGRACAARPHALGVAVAARDVLSGLRPQPRSGAARRTPRSCTRRRASAAAPATPRSTASRRAEPSTSRSPAPYAHATAPLRRLQDRYVSECCLAASRGHPDPRTGSAPGSPRCPTAMAAAGRRAATVERGVVDLVEAVAALRPRGRALRRRSSSTRSSCSCAEPAVRGKLDGDAPAPGNEVTVRLERADLATRSVRFTSV